MYHKVFRDRPRYSEGNGFVSVMKAFLLSANFKVVFLYRLRKYVEKVPVVSSLVDLLYWQVAFIQGIEIPKNVLLGEGFYVIHAGSVVINSQAVVGKNCTIVNCATIGGIFRGKKKGAPTIGDNVYIGPYSCILGNVKVGNNVAIGAHSVVLSDVPDNSVVVGSPARVISSKGAEEYIIRPV
jgi:serine O-acetyltransferase